MHVLASMHLCVHKCIVVIKRVCSGTFKTQGETMGFSRDWPGHLQRTCPHVDLDAIEWMSDVNAATIPYGILVRVYDQGDDKEDSEYCSPVD